MATKAPPKQLYITSKFENKGDVYPLGYMGTYDPKEGASFLKRKDSQFKWAYSSHGHGVEVKSVGVDHWIFGNAWRWDPITKKNEYEFIVQLATPGPMVWNNEPLEGFKILKSVSRYSTSNKLWRILDPRGIQFEISTGSFEDIVAATVIDHGLITGKCIWHGSKNLVVVP